MSARILDGYTYLSAWLTWVGSTTTALTGMGIDCDRAEVAALSGYAFILNIAEQQCCVSGPTAFNWTPLLHGLRAFGVEPIVFQPSVCQHPVKALREMEARALFERVKAEIDAGRPAVLWGTHCPEFGVAVGYDGDDYLVCSFKSHEEPRIRYDALQTPGGFYGLFLPPGPALDRRMVELEALHHAAAWMRGSDGSLGRTHTLGLGAYDAWIRCIERGDADEFGHAYNLAAWQEGRKQAAEWLARIAPKHPAATTELERAAVAYLRAADRMEQACCITPFPGGGLANASNREKVAGLLRAAAEAETLGVEALESALAHLDAEGTESAGQPLAALAAD
jgi:hypothetical protein